MIGQERVINDFQNLTRTTTDQDVLRFDVMMLGNGIEDAAVRSGVAISVLPSIVHRFHDAFGRAVWILVVRQLDELVVVGRFFRIRRTRHSLATSTLPGKLQRPQPGVAQQYSHFSHKISASNIRLHFKPPSRLEFTANDTTDSP